MNRIHIALCSPEKFVKLGNFNGVDDDDIVNLYYNLDLGNHRTNMFDVDMGAYKDLVIEHKENFSLSRFFNRTMYYFFNSLNISR